MPLEQAGPSVVDARPGPGVFAARRGAAWRRRAAPSAGAEASAAPRRRRAAPPAAAAPPTSAAAPAADAAAATAAPGFAQERCSAADYDSFLRGFRTQHRERTLWVDPADVVGTIPPDLRGTLLRNGPGLFEIGADKLPQPFDGDGMVAAFCFPGAGAPPFFANRFVRTEAFLKEQAAGRALFRGAFNKGGGIQNPFSLEVKNPANTGVVYHGGRLLALYERGAPYELAPPDLRTVGPSDLGGALNSDAKFLAAHYRRVRQADGSERLVAFNAVEAGVGDLLVTVWEYGPGFEVLHRTQRRLKGGAFGFLHDLAVTERSYVFVEAPVRLDVWAFATRYTLGAASIAECLRYDPGIKPVVHVFPRPGGGAAARPEDARAYACPAPFFAFHHANAYEAGGRLVLDMVADLDGIDFGANMDNSGLSYYEADVGRGSLVRLTVDLGSGAVAQTRLAARACEFPCVAPAAVGWPHRHAWLVGARAGPARWSPPQVLWKATLPVAGGSSGAAAAGADAAGADAEEAVYDPGPRRWCGEPVFVPRENPSAEDDGYLLSVVFDEAEDRSELAVVCAASMRLLAAVRLPRHHHLPHGLHGSWCGEFLGPGGDFAAASAYDWRAVPGAGAGAGARGGPTVFDVRSGAHRYE